MSDVLKDFIEPYKDMVDSDEAQRKLLTMAVLAWNAALLPDDRQKDMIDKALDKGLSDLPDDIRKDVRNFIDVMIARKKAYFSTIRRAIISFELEDRGKDFHLSVLSTLDDSPFS